MNAAEFRSHAARGLAAVALVAFAAIAGAAQPGPPANDKIPQIVTVENAIEASSDSVLLPTSIPGRLSITKCSGCPTTVVPVTSETRFVIGDAPVGLADLRSFLAARTRFVVVYVSVKDPAVTKIVVPLPPGQRR
jgi:hypothetical protein